MCIIWHESWQNKNLNIKKKNLHLHPCKPHKGMPRKFSSKNNMVPSPVLPELNDPTHVDFQSILFMQVYVRAKSGNLTYKEHVITLPHNVQNIVSILPSLSNKLSLVVFAAKVQNSEDLFFKVRCKLVWNSLFGFKQNNVHYKNVTNDEDRLNELPIHGEIGIKIHPIDDSKSPKTWIEKMRLKMKTLLK